MTLLLPMAGAEPDILKAGPGPGPGPIIHVSPPGVAQNLLYPQDGFAGATPITDADLPYHDTDSNVGASMEAGEPSPCDTGATIWYVYPTAYEQDIRADTIGSSFDTVLAVYQGSSLSELTLVTCNDDAVGLQSQVQFRTIPGMTYYFQLGGYQGAMGSTVLNVNYGCGGNDAMAAPCTATLRPHRTKTSTGGATVEASEPAFTCGFNVGKTVWYEFTPGPTATGEAVATTVGSSFDTVLQVFAIVGGGLVSLGCNDDGAGGGQSSVTFPVATGLTYLVQVGGYDQASGTLLLQIA